MDSILHYQQTCSPEDRTKCFQKKSDIYCSLGVLVPKVQYHELLIIKKILYE